MQPNDQSPATKADLRDFATKADLRDFATKADLRMFSTKDELSAFRAEMSSFADEVRGMFRQMVSRDEFRQTAIAVARLTEDVADIRNHIKEKLVTRDEFHSRMDGYARRVEDHDYSSAKNLHRLDDHEKRISALEEKRA